MTLAAPTIVKDSQNPISIDCPSHGHILDAKTEVQASLVAGIHNKAYHPRAYNRKLNKKR